MRLRHTFLCAALPIMVSAAPAAPSLEGWWRASLKHGQDSSEFYLLFEPRGERLLARFSIPAITADKSSLGHVEATPGRVKILEAAWELERSPDGSVLTGTIPSALLPIYKVTGTFRRSAAPAQLQSPRPERPAPQPMWTASLGEPVVGGLAADPAGQTIYVATTKGTVAALSAGSGANLWSALLDGPVRATPRPHGGALYVASDAALHKLDARTGRSQWRKPFGPPAHPILEISDGKSRWDHYSNAPVVAGGDIYVGSRDGCLYAFDADSGAARFKTCSKGSVTATPVVAADRAYFASFDHQLYAVRRKGGEIAWQADLQEPVTRDLALIGDTIIAGSRSYDLSAFDVRNGKKGWNRYIWFSWIDSAPSHDGRMLAIGSSDAQRIFAMDAGRGKPMWSRFIGGWAWAKPAITPRSVYAGAVGTTMSYVGRREGALAELDRGNGRIRWMYRPAHDPKALIWGFASDPLVTTRRLFAADLAGTVYAFAAN